MKKKTGLQRKQSDGFQLRYQSYTRRSVQDNTKENIHQAKSKETKYDKEIINHITSFNNVNQTMIGSIIYALLMDARTDSNRYMQNRLETLKNLYSFVETNRAWKDLWEVMVLIEQGSWSKETIISHQVLTEIMDMFRLNLPYAKMITGINEKTGQPIIKTPPFYLTKDTLNLIENPQSVGRKKTKELSAIQYQVGEWMHYLSFAFGLYNEETEDLMAQNGMNYSSIPDIKIPKAIAGWDELYDFIESHRKFTMNPYGVVIECQNCGDIEKIIMVEKDGFIVWKVHFKKSGTMLDHKGNLVEDPRGAEYCGYMDGNFFPRSLFTVHSDFIDFEMDLYQFIIECYADIVCGTEAVSKYFNRPSVNMGAVQINEDTDQMKVEQDVRGFRYTPRRIYNRAKAETSSREEFNRELEKYFIAGHLRKLPEHYSVSVEALQHASEFGIDIPQGYTFVRPYTAGEEKVRTHYVKRR